MFTPPTITSPSGCTDAFWEYNVKIANESPTATFPYPYAIQFFQSSNTVKVAQADGVYPGTITAGDTFIFDVEASVPQGQVTNAFKLTVTLDCCQVGVTTWN